MGLEREVEVLRGGRKCWEENSEATANQYLLSIGSGFARDQALRFLVDLQSWGVLEVRRATAYGRGTILRLCLPTSLGLELSLVGLKNQESG